MSSVDTVAERVIIEGKYICGNKYSRIEPLVEAALLAGRPVVIDVTRVQNKLQTEFYAYIVGTLRRLFPESEQLQRAEDITFLFAGREAPPYIHFCEISLDGFFSVGFQS